MQVQPSQQSSSSRVVSDPVISATPGKFYSYGTEFSLERPLAYLMDCKANKGRPITDAEDYASEHDLTFIFGGNTVRVCSPNAPESVELLGHLAEGVALNQTRIAAAGITPDEFYALRERKNGQALAEFCRAVVKQNERVVPLIAGSIIAVATKSGKFGLLLVKETTTTSIKVDACHILL